MTATISSVVAKVVESQKAGGAEYSGETSGFRFELLQAGTAMQTVGTYVGLPVTGRIHTDEGTSHKVSLLLHASAFAG